MRAARRCARAEHAQQRPQHARAHAHRPIHHREDGLGELGLEELWPRHHELGRGHVHAPPASLRGDRRPLQNDVLENGFFQPPLRLPRSTRKSRGARAHAAAIRGCTSEQQQRQPARTRVAVAQAVSGGGAAAPHLQDVGDDREEVAPPLGGDRTRVRIELTRAARPSCAHGTAAQVQQEPGYHCEWLVCAVCWF